ncbi:MAG: soluble lytic murein transglycosylase [Candidatus Berkelbacteria bacterium Athens1014_28]|uniref:Soluble lytic murein transglycosylase n=1 Tax=Candidatus Berkelbacteria bacterium Athens1014_28 TaxID=2017145 RepID=A0A554LP04_9BACT|nr:MAG: soluble lytic murein transglycosylase [Candidatus Berkelbacteria bacterium Athens1014_28]
MKKPRSWAKKIVAIIVIVGILTAGYFYLPSIIGDSVFPLRYENYIKKWAKEYNEDPFLIAGIAMLESGFNPDARSPVGALGIMQIMPPTGASIAKGVGMTDFTTSKLFDPETSIRFGTWYIHVMKEKYGGNVVAALAAYNAGSGNADKWLRAGLLTTPSSNSYARKVLGFVDVYHKLYDNQLRLDNAPAAQPAPIVKVSNPPPSIVWGQVLKNLVEVFGIQNK